jgi:hypothetical protein
MPDVRERLSTSCTKDLIGRSSESFTGSKDEAVVEEVEEVEAVDKDVCASVCCAMDKGIVHSRKRAGVSGSVVVQRRRLYIEIEP